MSLFLSSISDSSSSTLSLLLCPSVSSFYFSLYFIPICFLTLSLSLSLCQFGCIEFTLYTRATLFLFFFHFFSLNTLALSVCLSLWFALFFATLSFSGLFLFHSLLIFLSLSLSLSHTHTHIHIFYHLCASSFIY